MDPVEREKFEEMARRDMARYENEVRNYVPPPGTTFSRKKAKDPDAPKRPMSAYLSYANKIRGKVKAENPNCSNGEISKMLSGMWKGLPEDERKEYRDNEQLSWDIYKEKMVLWKKRNKGKKEEKTVAAGVFLQKPSKISMEKKDNHNMGSIDFSGHINNDAGVDEPLLDLGSVPGIDTNPNTDEITAVSALRKVRGGTKQHLEVGSGDPSQNNGFKGLLGANGPSGVHPLQILGGASSGGQAGYEQNNTSAFPCNQHDHSLGGNIHAPVIVAQLRGNPRQQDAKFMRKFGRNTFLFEFIRWYCYGRSCLEFAHESSGFFLSHSNGSASQSFTTCLFAELCHASTAAVAATNKSSSCRD